MPEAFGVGFSFQDAPVCITNKIGVVETHEITEPEVFFFFRLNTR